MIDFYAIRAAQHAWFLRLYEEWEPSRNLSQLPNWCVPFQIKRNVQLYTRSNNPRTNEDRFEIILVMVTQVLRRRLGAFPLCAGW